MPIRYITIIEVPPDKRASSQAVLSIFNSLGQTIGVPLAGSMIASQTSPVIGLQQFYLFASIMLAATVILTLFLKSRKQELAAMQLVEERKDTAFAVTPAPAPNVPGSARGWRGSARG